MSHPASLLFFLEVLGLILFSNLAVLGRLDRPPKKPLSTPPETAKVSLLVPARDEEAHIEGCLRSLLSQDYPDFEVIALDDHSQDRTGQILASLQAEYPSLRVLVGEDLPDGWLGKHWACHQLAQAARGELLLFTDADTRHHPQMLADSVRRMQADRLDMLTALPRQEVLTWGERLTVPLIYFCSLAFIPFALAYRLPGQALSFALGQFLLFRREAYWRTGGHAAVRDHYVDDLALGRQAKAHGLRWRVTDGSRRVTCRMYGSFAKAFNGLSKNLLAVFDYRVLPFLFAWIWLGIVFLEPLAGLLLSAVFGQFFVVFGQPGVPDVLWWASAASLALGLWSLIVTRFRFPWSVALAYPAIMALGVVMAFRSLYLTLSGRAAWKGRRLGRPAVRWL